MFLKIEDVNLLKLMKDIKNILDQNKLELKSNDYEIKLNKFEGATYTEPIKKLLDIMVKENYLLTEVFFQSEEDFENTFEFKYDDKVIEAFNSILVEQIVFYDEEEYSGTLIYHENNDGKLTFQLACIKYLSNFQKGELWNGIL